MSLSSPSHPFWTSLTVPVVVVGDVMLDCYLWGDASRISPEAPVPVVHVAKETATVGGAANVALNLARLGVPVHLVGAVGADAAGQKLRSLLADAEIAFTNVAAHANIPTIRKTRVLARSQQLVRLDDEAEPDAYRPTPEKMAEVAQALLPSARAVLVSDYGKGVVDASWLQGWREAATEAEALFAVDPKPRRPQAWPSPQVLTPNWGEAWELVGEPMRACDAQSRAELAQALRAKNYWGDTLVTLGADGMALMAEGQEVFHLPAHAREVFDVSGAGDTVFALFSLARSVGVSPEEAAQIANAAAAVVVAKVGTATVTLAEIQQELAG